MLMLLLLLATTPPTTTTAAAAATATTIVLIRQCVRHGHGVRILCRRPAKHPLRKEVTEEEHERQKNI